MQVGGCWRVLEGLASSLQATKHRFGPWQGQDSMETPESLPTRPMRRLEQVAKVSAGKGLS